MKNIYVMRDVVSGNNGMIFEAENDAVLRRSMIQELASVPEYIARDCAILCIGTIDYDGDNTPLLRSLPPRVVLTGMSPEIVDARKSLSDRDDGGESLA